MEFPWDFIRRTTNPDCHLEPAGPKNQHCLSDMNQPNLVVSFHTSDNSRQLKLPLCP